MSKPQVVTLAVVLDAPRGTLTLIVLVLFLAPIILGVMAAQDMTARGQSGLLYGGLVLVALPVGLAVWLYGRRKFPRSR